MAGAVAQTSPTEVARARLLELVSGGRDTPEDIVEAATPVTSPLHGYFEWDNDIAGHQYRLDQARRLIARVKVTTKVGNDTVKVRAVVNVTNGRDHFVVVEDHRNDPGFHAQQTERFCKEFKSLLTKYAYLLGDEEEVQNLVEAVVEETFT